jgi:hypothetical protein
MGIASETEIEFEMQFAKWFVTVRPFVIVSGSTFVLHWESVSESEFATTSSSASATTSVSVLGLAFVSGWKIAFATKS